MKNCMKKIYCKILLLWRDAEFHNYVNLLQHPQKMDNLWKKETGRNEYIDLFISVKHPTADQLTELLKTNKTQKNNQVNNNDFLVNAELIVWSWVNFILIIKMIHFASGIN